MHFFAQPVVTLVGLGIAIDFGLYIVSRFREEIAEGYDTEAAVRRTMMTVGPDGDVLRGDHRRVGGAAAAVPAGLPEVHHLRDHRHGRARRRCCRSPCWRRRWPSSDPTSTRSACGRCCGFRSCAIGSFSRRIIDWLAEKTQKTKTREEVEKGFWGKLVNRVMKRPDRLRRTDHHRDDPADHPAGPAGPRRHQREVPAAGQRRAPGAGRVRQDLPRLPHRAADAGDGEQQRPTRHRCADRRGAQQGDADPRLHRRQTTTRRRCGRNAPTSTARPRIRRCG